MGFATRCALIAVLALLTVSVGLGGTYDYSWSGPTSGGSWQGANWNGGLATGPLCTTPDIQSASVYIGTGNAVTVGGHCGAAGNLTLAAGAQLLIPAYSPATGGPVFQATSVVQNSGDIQLCGLKHNFAGLKA